ncbi:pyridoxal-dependent decarboxylase [Mycobacterium sp. 141]|uniref:pyridoxal phosphate-dependent decarboxylase family protein n=1 Tax=Mycobacterium sp. 141 TaxID=1120797 RepID=UPI00036A522B|nr:pyridoxal-dependent decarboxylase [Mycobacterium sp. 141]
MKADPSPFAADFVTASGLNGYREAMMLATTWVGTELAEQPTPGLVEGYADLKEAVDALPLDIPVGIGLPGALGEAVNLLARNSAAVTHPAYLAHLHCPPTVASLAAEVLINAFNQSMDSFDQAPAATAVEQRVIEYLCTAMGYDHGSDGTFTSGGTQSNLEALLIARDLFAKRTLGWDVATRGLPPEAPAWRVLCTRQTHFSVQQALRILGLAAAPVEIPTDSAGRLNIGALADEVAKAATADTPIMALVLTAGTTDYGAIDPLREAIAVARERNVWIHVDACAGGCLAFSDTHRHLLSGIELADSIAIDFHKLMFQAISCSALLVRQGKSFDVLAGHADYLNPEQDSDQDVVNLVGKSIQTTRRFDALKVWVTLRALGQRRIAEMVDATCAAAAAAAEAADRHPSLALLAPVMTNTVVLRWQHTGLSDLECDEINNAIRTKLAHSGHAIVGRSKAAGHQAIKLTFVNPLVTAELAAGTVAAIAEQGEQILRTRGREFTTA